MFAMQRSRRMMLETHAMPPSSVEIIKMTERFHFSGFWLTVTLSYAIEMMVPSLSTVMMTIAMTGRAKVSGRSPLF
jgi:hypothetical protein